MPPEAAFLGKFEINRLPVLSPVSDYFSLIFIKQNKNIIYIAITVGQARQNMIKEN